MSILIANNTVNIIMQSKGGAGKSVVSTMLSNYLKSIVPNTLCIDTDPNNKTLAKFKGFDVAIVDIVKKIGKERSIDQSKFDDVMEMLVENTGAGIVDTGSGDFIYINSYMINNDIPEILEENEKQLVIHVPINHGQSADETMACLFNICQNYPKTPVVIWDNEWNGIAPSALDIEKINKATKGNVIGLVKLEKRNSETFEADFSKMLSNKMTFDEALASGEFKLAKSRRLKIIRDDIYTRLDDIYRFDIAD